jgi:hypothetical protein
MLRSAEIVAAGMFWSTSQKQKERSGISLRSEENQN